MAKHAIRHTIVSALASALLIASGQGMAQGLTSITIVQQHAPVSVGEEVFFYAVPKQLGYFEAEGLDVSLESVANAGAAAQVLQSGSAQFATTQPEAILNLRENGGDALAIFALRHGNGSKLGLLPDSPIETLEDLRGTVVGGLSWGAGGAPILMRMLSDIGIGPDEYERVSVSAGPASAAALQNRQIDALVLWDSAFASFENAGMEFRYIEMPMLREMGAQVIATTESFAQNNPAEVEGFCRAVVKGLHFTRTNMEAAIELFFEEFPAARPANVDDERLLADSVHVLNTWISAAFWDVPYGERAGEIPDGTWARTQEFYVEAGSLQGSLDPEDGYTGAFLDACNDIDHDAVAAEAEAYQVSL